MNGRLIDKEWLLSRKQTKCPSLQRKNTNAMQYICTIIKYIGTQSSFVFSALQFFYVVRAHQVEQDIPLSIKITIIISLLKNNNNIYQKSIYCGRTEIKKEN